MPSLIRLSLIFLSGTTNSAISLQTSKSIFGWWWPATNQSA